MIPFAFDPAQLRASSFSRRLEERYEHPVTEARIHAPDRVVASDPDPTEEWLRLAGKTEVSVQTLRLPLPDTVWTGVHQQRFLELAGGGATTELGPAEQAELEHLSQLRRRVKNRRSGEELLVEYQQRELTRELINALSRYVTFHKPADRQTTSQP